VLGKRSRESLGRAAATLSNEGEACVANSTREIVLSSNMVDPTDSLELPPLHYLIVAVNKEPLRALVDSGLTRTIFGAEATDCSKIKSAYSPTSDSDSHRKWADSESARRGRSIVSTKGSDSYHFGLFAAGLDRFVFGRHGFFAKIWHSCGL